MKMLKAIEHYALQSNDVQELEEILANLETMKTVKSKEYNKVLNETITTITNHKEAQ